jgi:hypothetical protein
MGVVGCPMQGNIDVVRSGADCGSVFGMFTP